MKNLGLYGLKETEQLQKNNEIIEVIGGCLLDSILLYLLEYNQYAVCLEHALNTWSSCLQVYVGSEEEIYSMWNEFKTKIKKGQVVQL